MTTMEVSADMAAIFGCACQHAHCPLCFPQDVPPGESSTARQARRLASLERTVYELLDVDRGTPEKNRAWRARLLPAYYAITMDLAHAAALLDAERGPRLVLVCTCGRGYTSAEWLTLDERGAMGDGIALWELRNCGSCGSTRMVRTAHPAPPTREGLPCSS